MQTLTYCRPSPRIRRLLPGTVLTAATLLGITAGCQRPAGSKPQDQSPAPRTEAVVRVVKPERRSIRHLIEQPGFNIEAFQETPLYAKISAYVRKWNVDIGDRIRKDEVLAELYVPEMEVDLRQKEAAILQAAAQIKQAQAAILTAQAQLERLKSQYERLSRVGTAVLDRENVEESRLAYRAAQAGLEKARADVAVAEAQLQVVEANRDYSRTLLQYAQIRAPFDGVVTQRNINTGNFVQPGGAGARGKPLYVVDQVDPVRVFVNIPGADAPLIRDGDPVNLRLQGAGGEPLQGKVTRNARSLDPQARTLRIEIDLPNPKGTLLPGMYVQAGITIEHRNAWTLPAAAIVTEGDQTFCYQVEDGSAVRTPLQIGLSGGGLVEVLKKQTKAVSSADEGRWEDFTGEEQIVAGDPARLTDGQPVQPALEAK